MSLSKQIKDFNSICGHALAHPIKTYKECKEQPEMIVARTLGTILGCSLWGTGAAVGAQMGYESGGLVGAFFGAAAGIASVSLGVPTYCAVVDKMMGRKYEPLL